jgi:hypothetical protein
MKTVSQKEFNVLNDSANVFKKFTKLVQLVRFAAQAWCIEALD